MSLPPLPPVQLYCWTCEKQTLHHRRRLKLAPGDLVRNVSTCEECAEDG